MRKLCFFLFATLVAAVSCTKENPTPAPSSLEMVDLGLSVKWASCNVGATKPEEYGTYFAWGDVVGQTWDGSKWSGAGFSTAPKYEVDANGNLKPEYDAAHVNLGGDWRMPTKEEQQALIDNCTSTWVKNYQGTRVAGRVFTSKINGNSIFMPAGGRGYNYDLNYAGSGGYYWSSTFSGDNYAWYLRFSSGDVSTNDNYRLRGQSVRAVADKSAPDPKEGALSGVFTVNASGTKVHFAKGNLYYTGSAFQFEANQYDFRHYNGKTGDKAVINGISTTTPSGTVGSFFWSKTVSVAYAGTYYDASAASTDVLFTNNTMDTPKGDFTCNGVTGVWRTLSGGEKGEWQYLLSERTVNGGAEEGKSYQRATIRSDVSGGIYGLIIYPDNYTSQTTATSYTSSEWTTMESAGCVFLPAAGYRDDSGLSDVCERGFYWSSMASNATEAYRLGFGSLYVYPTKYSGRDYGRSIRLVTAAQ